MLLDADLCCADLIEMTGESMTYMQQRQERRGTKQEPDQIFHSLFPCSQQNHFFWGALLTGYRTTVSSNKYPRGLLSESLT
jgi:hypothetical protein